MYEDTHYVAPGTDAVYIINEITKLTRHETRCGRKELPNFNESEYTRERCIWTARTELRNKKCGCAMMNTPAFHYPTDALKICTLSDEIRCRRDFPEQYEDRECLMDCTPTNYVLDTKSSKRVDFSYKDRLLHFRDGMRNFLYGIQDLFKSDFNQRKAWATEKPYNSNLSTIFPCLDAVSNMAKKVGEEFGGKVSDDFDGERCSHMVIEDDSTKALSFIRLFVSEWQHHIEMNSRITRMGEITGIEELDTLIDEIKHIHDTAKTTIELEPTHSDAYYAGAFKECNVALERIKKELEDMKTKTKDCSVLDLLIVIYSYNEVTAAELKHLRCSEFHKWKIFNDWGDYFHQFCTPDMKFDDNDFAQILAKLSEIIGKHKTSFNEFLPPDTYQQYQFEERKSILAKIIKQLENIKTCISNESSDICFQKHYLNWFTSYDRIEDREARGLQRLMSAAEILAEFKNKFVKTYCSTLMTRLHLRQAVELDFSLYDPDDFNSGAYTSFLADTFLRICSWSDEWMGYSCLGNNRLEHVLSRTLTVNESLCNSEKNSTPNGLFCGTKESCEINFYRKCNFTEICQSTATGSKMCRTSCDKCNEIYGGRFTQESLYSHAEYPFLLDFFGGDTIPLKNRTITKWQIGYGQYEREILEFEDEQLDFFSMIGPTHKYYLKLLEGMKVDLSSLEFYLEWAKDMPQIFKNATEETERAFTCLRDLDEKIYGFNFTRHSWYKNLQEVLADPGLVTDENYNTKSLSKVTVMFSSFSTNLGEQKPAFTVFDFLADVGGTIGLYLGATVVTFFEFFFILFHK